MQDHNLDYCIQTWSQRYKRYKSLMGSTETNI